jgi:hypothetical protein
MKQEEAIERIKARFNKWALDDEDMKAIQTLIPELRENEDERIRKALIEGVRQIRCKNGITQEQMVAYLEKQKETGIRWFKSDNVKNPDKPYIDKVGMFYTTDGRMCYASEIEKQKEQKPIKMETYEIGKGTTICGQDYKCKKDYKAGNCWYIKDAIYHCGRDGYLTDQNGVSWSCTPEWFKEYIQSNTEWAEEEKTHFVSGQFLQCKLSFDGFKESEHYWLEYVGDDMYVGRSDNILNQKFHITPRQLYTLFSQQLEEKQKENPKSADSIPSDVKCEDRWHKISDSLPDDAREVICKDAIGNFFIGRYYKASASWEVMMYDDCDKSNEDNPPVVKWCEIPSEKQKEQKPIKWTDLTWKDIVELEGIINNVHYDFSDGIGQESFGKEVLERFRSTKGIEYLDEAEQKCWQEEEQKEQKQNPDKEKLIKHCIGLILIDATDKRFKDYSLTLKDCLIWLGRAEEQKSVTNDE